ncbi:RsmB/NOP family class I SAM-dependent RNA methyltransferase [Pseudooceanicola sp.]|uniref:RsmB/NOP family class I SAM-dependent RNA methyltransferase n=1 Tax=Pseudooceanicola sp. TaxID=1914328 RepID=UPI002613296D|nr:RsmB/NOP family class I SAM-dependent RNA methyltransferase [Pseudooceanicola sp.]MDF1856596.1 RsmB/NOP family class I SAM-dependent RNA methyltransferase [Pseudooceanicola sp.]
MTPDARIAASAELLDEIALGRPAAQVLINWARSNRYAGSSDRAAVRDHVYDALRRRRSAAARGGGDTGRALMIGLLREAGRDPETVFTGIGHAPAPLTPEDRQHWREPDSDAEACDLPDWLRPELERGFGANWPDVALALRDRAPVWLRVNPRKANLDEAVAALAEDSITALPEAHVQGALMVTTGPRKIATSRAYTTGMVEIQDLSSQAVVATLPLADGQSVLDYCAGGGGKTLAMAGRAAARFHCHDALPRRMADLPARAARAGVEITTLAPADLAASGPFDLVFCDAPCSGSGSWRRDPEGKWALTAETLAERTRLQDDILNAAAPLVAPQGVLAYATCSLLSCENEDRIAAFQARHPEWQAVFSRQLDLSRGGDGFYIAHLTRK